MNNKNRKNLFIFIITESNILSYQDFCFIMQSRIAFSRPYRAEVQRGLQRPPKPSPINKKRNKDQTNQKLTSRTEHKQRETKHRHTSKHHRFTTLPHMIGTPTISASATETQQLNTTSTTQKQKEEGHATQNPKNNTYKPGRKCYSETEPSTEATEERDAAGPSQKRPTGAMIIGRSDGVPSYRHQASRNLSTRLMRNPQ